MWGQLEPPPTSTPKTGARVCSHSHLCFLPQASRHHTCLYLTSCRGRWCDEGRWAGARPAGPISHDGTREKRLSTSHCQAGCKLAVCPSLWASSSQGAPAPTWVFHQKMQTERKSRLYGCPLPLIHIVTLTKGPRCFSSEGLLMISYSPGIQEPSNGQRKSQDNIYVNEGLRVQHFQRTSEPHFVNGLEESLNTVPVWLLQPLMAPGQRLTHNHSNCLGLGSTHSFRQTKRCMVCSHAWVLHWASGGRNKVILLFARQSDFRAEGGVTPPCHHTLSTTKYGEAFALNIAQCLLYNDRVHISFTIHQLLNRQ